MQQLFVAGTGYVCFAYGHKCTADFVWQVSFQGLVRWHVGCVERTRAS